MVLGAFKDKSVTYDNIVSGLKAIRRLQIIYELDAHEISNGRIGGHPSKPFDGNNTVINYYRLACIYYYSITLYYVANGTIIV